ncbi:hypothetical protein HanRHA438_Chr14g0660791 [Helianthus annuus]|nr:hypothetical protein HanRHA438_Chr14g0660791 [Helianthus annuus]
MLKRSRSWFCSVELFKATMGDSMVVTGGDGDLKTGGSVPTLAAAPESPPCLLTGALGTSVKI